MTKEEKFWEWFKKNNSKYFFLNQMENIAEREILLDDFLNNLHLYCNKLFFKIGGKPNERQDLIISSRR